MARLYLGLPLVLLVLGAVAAAGSDEHEHEHASGARTLLSAGTYVCTPMAGAVLLLAGAHLTGKVEPVKEEEEEEEHKPAEPEPVPTPAPGSLPAHGHEAKELRAQLHRSQDKEEEAEADAKKAESAEKEAKQRAAEAKGQLNEAEARASQEEEKLRDAEEQLRRSEKRRKRLESLESEEEEKLSDAEEQLRSSENRRKRLESEMKGSESGAEKDLEEQLDSAQAVQEHLKSKLESARAKEQQSEEALESLRATLAKSKDDLQQAHEDLREAQGLAEQRLHRIRELESEAGKPGPVETWLRAVTHQAALAACIGVFGLLTVAGPMTFVHCYKAVVGSALGGLLLASGVEYLLAVYHGRGESLCWLDVVVLLLTGGAHKKEYIVIAVMVLLGTMRWYFGWEWLLYAVLDDVYMSRPVAECYLKEPLLGRHRLPTSGRGAAEVAPAPAAEVEAAPRPSGNSHGRDSDYGDMGGPHGVGRALSIVRGTAAGDDRLSAAQCNHIWDSLALEAQHGLVGDEVMIALMNQGLGQDSPGGPERSVAELVHVLEDLRDGTAAGNGQPEVIHHPSADIPPPVGPCTVDEV